MEGLDMQETLDQPGAYIDEVQREPKDGYAFAMDMCKLVSRIRKHWMTRSRWYTNQPRFRTSAGIEYIETLRMPRWTIGGVGCAKTRQLSPGFCAAIRITWAV